MLDIYIKIVLLGIVHIRQSWTQVSTENIRRTVWRSVGSRAAAVREYAAVEFLNLQTNIWYCDDFARVVAKHYISLKLIKMVKRMVGSPFNMAI